MKEDNKSVCGAAKQFNVPITTLRDRILGNIDPETVKSGRSPLLSSLQEAELVDHLKLMADYGYGYSRQEVVDLASDLAVQLGIRDKHHPFTLNWFRSFVTKWPEIRVLKPRGLEVARAKAASAPVVEKYFTELEDVIKANGLEESPQLIYNVDEKGFSQNHSPPAVVCGSKCPPQAVTSGKSSTTTVIGCGSASGSAIPPFFVFPGKKMMEELMAGATPGAAGRVSDSGWSNSQIFREYLEEHFLKYVPLKDGQKVLLLLDGHKSHASVRLAQWARDRNIILFILPAHTSHLLQPLDVACYGPMQRMYNSECQKFLRESHGVITRYNVCQLVCKVYNKAISADNLIAAFQKTGIHPLKSDVISPENLRPSEVFVGESESDEMEEREVEKENEEMIDPKLLFKEKEEKLKEVKSAGNKKRKTMSAIVSGRCITEDRVLEQMVQHAAEHPPKKPKKNVSPSGESQEPGTSGSKKGKRASKKNTVENSAEDSEEVEIGDDELCCVCKQFTPKEIRESDLLLLTKWAQCDGMRNGFPCNHWTHLKYCCSTRVIRRNDKFFCPHCR